MDTSKEYIKMCEKAFSDIGEAVLYKDILSNLWSIKLKDGRKFVYNTSEQRLKPRTDERWGRTNDWFPIYRQDQLQEMVRQGNELPFEMIGRMFRWASKGNILFVKNSMEQLWLAFVMKEKYNKTWSEEKWYDEEY